MYKHRVFLSIESMARARRANFRIYLKKIVWTRRDEIVSKRYDKYKYSPVEAALPKFFPLLREFSSLFFFSYYDSFSPIFSLVKNQQRPVRSRCLKTHDFRACVKEKYFQNPSWKTSTFLKKIYLLFRQFFMYHNENF